MDLATVSGNDHESFEMLGIATVCTRLQLTPRALRFYEERGLLAPARKGTARLYTAADVEQAETIVALKKLGFTLAEIATMLKASSGGPACPLTADQCLRQMAFLRTQLEETNDALAELRELSVTLEQRTVA